MSKRAVEDGREPAAAALSAGDRTDLKVVRCLQIWCECSESLFTRGDLVRDLCEQLLAILPQFAEWRWHYRVDLDALEDVTVECSGQPFIIRSQTRGDAGKALQAAGVALGPAVRPV